MGGTTGAVLDALQHLPRNLVWRFKRERTVSVADVEATFTTGSLPEAAQVDNFYRTERAMLTAMLETVQPDDVVWDVGANYGFYTCLVGDTLEDGGVVAFEPLECNVERLAAEVSSSDVDANVRQIALGDRARTVTFDPPSFTNRYRGTTGIAPEANGQAIDVQMDTGDRLVERGEVAAPSVVKIDVEGAEGLVLEGMERLLATECRAVFCEVHPERLSEFGTTREDVLGRLDDLGYEAEVVHEHGDTLHLKAVRES